MMLPIDEYWKDYLNAALACITMVSCLLLVNAIPARTRWPEKVVVGVVALGAAGVTFAPFVGRTLLPTFYELVFHGSAAMFSVMFTMQHWCEMPLLGRCLPQPRFDRRSTDVCPPLNTVMSLKEEERRAAGF